MKVHIQRSKKTLEAILISSTLAAFVAMLVTILLLSELRSVTGLSSPILRGLILSAFPLAWVFSSITAYLNWNKIKYSYDENRLTISRSHAFSGTEITSFSYEGMGAVSLVQTKFGKKNNFGDIIIQLQNESNPIILRVIDNPSKHLHAIEKNIARKKVIVQPAV